jgi:hypothetical protein
MFMHQAKKKKEKTQYKVFYDWVKRLINTVDVIWRLSSFTGVGRLSEFYQLESFHIRKNPRIQGSWWDSNLQR